MNTFIELIVHGHIGDTNLGLILDATGLTNSIDPQEGGRPLESPVEPVLSAILTVLFFLLSSSNSVPFLKILNIYYFILLLFKKSAGFYCTDAYF